LVFLLIKGAGAINWDFLTKTPSAVGEPGGGIANSLPRQFTIVGLASLMGVLWE